MKKRLKKGLFLKTRCERKKRRLKNKNRKSPYRETNRTFVYFVFPNVSSDYRATAIDQMNIETYCVQRRVSLKKKKRLAPKHFKIASC